jgi:8-oxo-dGTP diphosphatase
VTGPGARRVVPVAVGIVTCPDGSVLLADRPGARAYAGYWEFPGGKIEDGESVEHALARELAEELRITVVESMPWVVFDFDYPHAYVRLHFRRVVHWQGTPSAAEGQRLMFHRPGTPPPVPLLPAARPVMRWLDLPERLSWPSAPDSASPLQLYEILIDGARWQAATVRNREELAQAVASGADFAVAPALAEQDLTQLARTTPIPLYATASDPADTPERMRRLGLQGLVDRSGSKDERERQVGSSASSRAT